MNRLFMTGDTHIPIDIAKLNNRNFPIQKELTKSDNVGIDGDHGLIWNYKETGLSVPSCPEDTCWTKEELFWYNWLNERNFTTIWVDGNHENFDRLKKYPVTEWNGGKVQKISESIIHLMRGEVYDINGIKIFTFGGARSTDRGDAVGNSESVVGKYWWREELPSMAEMENARANLAKHDHKVDIIMTHALPNEALISVGYHESDILTSFLQEIAETTTFDKWFAGHYHINRHLLGKYIAQYDDIYEYEKIDRQ